VTVDNVSVELQAHAPESAVTSAEPLFGDAADTPAEGSEMMDWPDTGTAARGTSANARKNSPRITRVYAGYG